ncbi:TetR/AcrR family transcriptional regulator [Oceanobacillus polygoni]|uniref:AcrR family transcriptional regulator n=1 Tax=Oceanobacillus polygoni TaxID=1235259 RepID=A0A9X0Z345_9BACI|nr:TetR/AcrR family transcriptional regulator [Oceanobacillus polygoni]MBP2079921.1 AcrR family transcriptional regulator [Oceanobacillus polygoni]
MTNNETKLTKKQIAILEAATDLFAEKGYAGTSTSEIANKANVAEGTIFKHFKSKKGLLLSIVSPMMVKLIAPMVKNDMNKVLDQDFERFQDFIRAMIENRKVFIKKNLPLLRILIQEIPFHPELKEQFIEHIGKDIFARLRQIVEHYQAKGQLIQTHPDTIIRIVASSIFSYIIARYVIVPEGDWNDEEEVERIIQVLENGIVARE